MFESAVNIVLVIFIMIFLGFIFQRKGWFGKNAETILSRITLRVGMPGLVFSNIMTNYSREMLIKGAPSLLVPFCTMAVCYLLSGLLARWLKIPSWREGVFRGVFTFGNSAFLGMPVCLAIFGNDAMPTILLYYLVNTLFWWLVGAPRVARDSGAYVRNPLKRVASPPLVTTVLSLALVLLGIRPPEVLITAGGYLGGLVTPLSMLFIGCMLSTMLKGGLRWQKGYGAVLLGRFLLAPLLCLPLSMGLGLSGQTLGVFFVQSGMPSQTQTCLWAQEQGGDAEYAAGAIALSTLLGLAAIPAYAWFLGVIG